MHQNLRTSFVLNEEKVSDSKNLSKQQWEENSEKEQEAYLQEMQTLIPATQYGTFFCIYAKFTGSFVDQGFQPKTCDLFLQNYDGDVTVGLVSMDSDIDIIFDPLIGSPVYLFKIHVKALHANTKLEKPQEIKFRDSVSLKNYSGFEDNSWNIDAENNAINPKFLARILLYYDKLGTDIFNPKEDVNESIFIDSHKYQRDGDELFLKNYKRVKGEGFEPMDQNITEEEESKGIIRPKECAPKYVKFYLSL